MIRVVSVAQQNKGEEEDSHAKDMYSMFSYCSLSCCAPPAIICLLSTHTRNWLNMPPRNMTIMVSSRVHQTLTCQNSNRTAPTSASNVKYIGWNRGIIKIKYFKVFFFSIKKIMKMTLICGVPSCGSCNDCHANHASESVHSPWLLLLLLFVGGYFMDVCFCLGKTRVGQSKLTKADVWMKHWDH